MITREQEDKQLLAEFILPDWAVDAVKDVPQFPKDRDFAYVDGHGFNLWFNFNDAIYDGDYIIARGPIPGYKAKGPYGIEDEQVGWRFDPKCYINEPVEAAPVVEVGKPDDGLLLTTEEMQKVAHFTAAYEYQDALRLCRAQFRKVEEVYSKWFSDEDFVPTEEVQSFHKKLRRAAGLES